MPLFLDSWKSESLFPLNTYVQQSVLQSCGSSLFLGKPHTDRKKNDKTTKCKEAEPAVSLLMDLVVRMFLKCGFQG